jgi:hypothetical protein
LLRKDSVWNQGSTGAGGQPKDALAKQLETARPGVLASIDTHIAEHLGQAIAYARINGIVPPLSQ